MRNSLSKREHKGKFMDNHDDAPKSKSGFLGRLFGGSARTPTQGVSATDPPPAPQRNWWHRLQNGLARSSRALSQSINDVLTKRRLDRAMLDELEDILIRADLGVATATHITTLLHKQRYDTDISPDEVKAILAHEIETILTPLAQPLRVDEQQKPFVILVVGVNGSGKTTTIGKLTALFRAQGKKVLLAAGDTFRAAAIEQLQIWGERLGAQVVARAQGADASGLAFDAIRQAKETGCDIVLMDTAGRLHNRTELMAELEKIVRVIKKADAGAPHAVLLVLDATIGQNALNQVEIFGKTAGVTGLVMTKLDGTARGGILVAIAQQFKLPIHFIGVGETVDDLEPFTAHEFAQAIIGPYESTQND
jgi:fused signal recognition particle receptor